MSVATWRNALRGLRRNPGFTTAACSRSPSVSGATAAFSVVNTVLLEPLPYKDADQLVRVVERAAPRGPNGPVARRITMTWAELGQWRQSSSTLSDLVYTISPPITLMPTWSGSARLTGALVSSNTFAFLGATARLGRTLDQQDDAAGANTVVISSAAWQRYFQGDPSDRRAHHDAQDVRTRGRISRWHSAGCRRRHARELRLPIPELRLIGHRSSEGSPVRTKRGET